MTNSEYFRQHYQDHREKKLAYAKAYYTKNRDRMRAQQAQYQKLHRAERIAYEVKRTRQRYLNFRSIITAYKETHPCVDCGKFYAYYVMEFDHVRGVKLGNLASPGRWGCSSLEKLIAEIEKCEVVCANCHRVRTHQRAQSRYGGKYGDYRQKEAL
jgi:hypothetical protein